MVALRREVPLLIAIASYIAILWGEVYLTGGCFDAAVGLCLITVGIVGMTVAAVTYFFAKRQLLGAVGNRPLVGGEVVYGIKDGKPDVGEFAIIADSAVPVPPPAPIDTPERVVQRVHTLLRLLVEDIEAGNFTPDATECEVKNIYHELRHHVAKLGLESTK